MRTITALTAAALTGAAGLAITAAAVLPAGADTPSDDDGTTSFLEDRLSRIREALEGLVGDGTLTPEEADAVAETLNDSDLFRPHRPGGHMDGLGLDVAAETLGLTEDELLTQLRDGATLAEIAADQGVETQTLVDALVAAASERIDEAVADGRLDQDRADEMKADLESRIATAVEEGFPMRDGRDGGHPHGGRGMPDMRGGMPDMRGGMPGWSGPDDSTDEDASTGTPSLESSALES